MTCVGVSDNLYPGGTFIANSCIVCAGLSLLYAPEVMLHSTRITVTFIMFTGLSVVLRESSNNLIANRCYSVS